MAKRYPSPRPATLARRPMRFLACSAAVLVTSCWSVQVVGDEPSLDGLLSGSGLEIPSHPSLAEAPHGDTPPLPISEPAPLEVDAVTLGPVDSQDAELGVDYGAANEGSLDVEVDREQENLASSAATPREVEVIRERYSNRNVKIEREVTQDEEGNYVNHGSWKMWDERGNLVAEGRYDMGARTGRWTRWHRRDDSPLFNALPFAQAQAPFVSQATFKKDALDGDWVIYDSKQRQLSRIGFASGQRHGPAVLWLPTGQVIRQMSYTNGELDGNVMEAGKDGKLVKTAIFQAGRQLVQKTTEFKSSRDRQTEAVYLVAKLVTQSPDDFWNARFAEYEKVGKDERHGPWVTFYQNGQVQVQGQYQNDLEDGKFTWWHENGQKYSEGEYVDGRQHGVWQWWHRNGQKWIEGEFNKGEQTGEWLSWSEDGRLDQQASYSGHRPQNPMIAAEKDEPNQSSRRLK